MKTGNGRSKRHFEFGVYVKTKQKTKTNAYLIQKVWLSDKKWECYAELGNENRMKLHMESNQKVEMKMYWCDGLFIKDIIRDILTGIFSSFMPFLNPHQHGKENDTMNYLFVKYCK